MLKKLVLLLASLLVTMSIAFAATVDVNTADKAALESLKGIGPVKSQAIIDERSKHGAFKDADDLARRVPGLGVKSVTKLEAEGLTVGGSSAPPTAAGGKHEKAPAATASNAAQPPAKAAAVTPAPSTAAPASATAPSMQSEKSHKPGKKSKAKGASAASGA